MLPDLYRFPWVVTRLGAAIGLAYGLAAITVFVSVVTIWPAASVPSLNVMRPTFPIASIPVATPRTSTERPTRSSIPAPSIEPLHPTAPPIMTIRSTFYCLSPLSPCTVGFPAVGMYAAAGGELRAALGDWRGRKVTVWHGAKHVTVTLIDTCSCDIDLYAAAFLVLGPLELGVLDVEVRW